MNKVSTLQRQAIVHSLLCGILIFFILFSCVDKPINIITKCFFRAVTLVQFWLSDQIFCEKGYLHHKVMLPMQEKDFVKHEYLRSRAYRCLSLWSSSSSHLSVKSLRFFGILTFIEILVLISWIPASENFLIEFDLLQFSQTHISYSIPNL